MMSAYKTHLESGFQLSVVKPNPSPPLTMPKPIAHQLDLLRHGQSQNVVKPKPN